MPPPLPRAAAQESLEPHIKHCEILCIVVASIFVIGLFGFTWQYFEEGHANWHPFGFAVAYFLLSCTAAVLLHLRRPAAYFAALPCFLVMLLIIPIGTVGGIFGIIWLNKGRPALK